jgi:hypothetical protein
MSFEIQPPSGKGDGKRPVQRVTLPSGKKIKITYFYPQQEKRQTEQDIEKLEECPECERDFVYPVEWEEVSKTQWEVLLRCPNCEWTHLGVYDQKTVDRFDGELDKSTEFLVEDLTKLTHDNMKEELGRFVTALEANAIWPMDFGSLPKK